MPFSCTLGILNQAVKKKLLYVNIPYSKKGYNLIKLIYKLGYINTYYLSENKISIVFKWYKNDTVIGKLFFYSTPGNIKTIAYKDLIALNKKNYILLNSTGICTSEEALFHKKGGILIAEIV